MNVAVADMHVSRFYLFFQRRQNKFGTKIFFLQKHDRQEKYIILFINHLFSL